MSQGKTAPRQLTTLPKDLNLSLFPRVVSCPPCQKPIGEADPRRKRDLHETFEMVRMVRWSVGWLDADRGVSPCRTGLWLWRDFSGRDDHRVAHLHSQASH